MVGKAFERPRRRLSTNADGEADEADATDAADETAVDGDSFRVFRVNSMDMAFTPRAQADVVL
jgi:hypothetical protein